MLMGNTAITMRQQASLKKCDNVKNYPCLIEVPVAAEIKVVRI